MLVGRTRADMNVEPLRGAGLVHVSPLKDAQYDHNRIELIYLPHLLG